MIQEIANNAINNPYHSGCRAPDEDMEVIKETNEDDQS